MGWQEEVERNFSDLRFFEEAWQRRRNLMDFFGWLVLPMRILDREISISSQLRLQDESELDFVICPKTGRYVELGAGG